MSGAQRVSERPYVRVRSFEVEFVSEAVPKPVQREQAWQVIRAEYSQRRCQAQFPRKRNTIQIEQIRSDDVGMTRDCIKEHGLDYEVTSQNNFSVRTIDSTDKLHSVDRGNGHC